ncbi:MAG: glycosyltransferase family 4 protein [Bryobacteraceae bacterium]|jgi:glycosyltransferase involved in cell wall biosynthesis
MRVLQLDAGGDMRGGQWQALRLIEGLAAEGVESTLLALAGSPLFDAARREGWRVEPINLLRTLACARTHDLLHAHDARGHAFGLFATRRPLLVSRRVAFPVRSRWKYSRPARFLAVSEFVKSVLTEGGVPADKITVIYDGVPLLEQSHGSQIIALRKDGVAPELDLAISQHLESDLRDAAILVYLTASEGLGSGALLAMSAGVPVIASRVGGLPEVVHHRETGLLVENTAESVVAAIRELTEDRTLARRLGEAGRRAVSERFTVQHMVRRTMEVYIQALSS